MTMPTDVAEAFDRVLSTGVSETETPTNSGNERVSVTETATQILRQIRSAGGSIRLDGDLLRISLPPGTIDRSLLTAHRLDLLRLLAHERISEVLDRFAEIRPRSYSSVPDGDAWDRLEDQVDAALRSGAGIGAAIDRYEREGAALLAEGGSDLPKRRRGTNLPFSSRGNVPNQTF